MQALLIGLWWVAALVTAVVLIFKARPPRVVERYRTEVYIKDVEPMTENDTMRSLPYEVTVLLPSLEPDSIGTYHSVALNPEDLNVGRARNCARYRTSLPAWVSTVDPHDIRFVRDDHWSTEKIIHAVLLLIAQFVMTALCLSHLDMLLNSDPYLVLLFPPTMLVLGYLALFGLWRFIRTVMLWVRLTSAPATVAAAITGVRQLPSRAGHPGGFEVSLMWAPLGMPIQFSTVRIPSSQRRTRILLQKLIRVQLEEESQGKWRVRPPEPPAAARSAVSRLHTPEGPATVKITALPQDDPRFDPRPPKVRAAAEKARHKREAELLAQREAFEAATAKARIEQANRAELGSEDNSLDELAAAGPMAWYYPMNPSRVNLVGAGATPGGRSNLIGAGLGWLAVAVLAGLSLIWLGVVNPELMFPVYEAPSGDQPLGGWTR